MLGANRELAGAEVELVDLERRDQRLKSALEVADKDFDFVLIDCPPSLSMLTLNGLCAAHGVIVPMQCEYFALEGLTDLVNTIKQVHANLNPDLKIIGLLRVMFDPRITLQQQVSDQLKSHFGDKVFNTVIPRNVRLAEAPSYGLPGVVFDPSAKGSQAFVWLLFCCFGIVKCKGMYSFIEFVENCFLLANADRWFKFDVLYFIFDECLL